MHFNLSNKKALTLMEMIVVILVIAVLASLALPKYTSVMERMRSREGADILMAIYMAQKENHRETGNYHKANLAALNTDLDVTISTANHFSSIQTLHDTGNVSRGQLLELGGCGSVLVISRVTRTNQEYNLYVTEEGKVICTTSAPSCSGICQKMGFPQSW